MYLMGAYELRHGIAGWGGRRSDRSDYFRAMNSELLLDYMGIRLNGERAGDKTLSVNLHITDTAETFLLELTDSVLIYTAGSSSPDADVSVTLTHQELSLVANNWAAGDELPSTVACTGNRQLFLDLLSCLDKFDGAFCMVEP
jgi:alkyl sulfatase BDS1-like metallo-beta-lactamase superfamily hydrolase